MQLVAKMKIQNQYKSFSGVHRISHLHGRDVHRISHHHGRGNAHDRVQEQMKVRRFREVWHNWLCAS